MGILHQMSPFLEYLILLSFARGLNEIFPLFRATVVPETLQHESRDPRSFKELDLMKLAEDLNADIYIPFSLRLDLTYNRLSTIRHDNRNDTVSSFLKVLQVWQKSLPAQVDQPETMARILDACDEKRLADKIRKYSI